jgi:CubicO group peptidase (beta-lactamase class C family)
MVGRRAVYMRRLSYLHLMALISIAVFSNCGTSENGSDRSADNPGANLPWPTNNWEFCSPESVGMDYVKLEEALAYAIDPNTYTEGVMIVRKGYIVGEAYVGRFTIDSRHASWSAAKSFTSALIGIAVGKGLIGSIEDNVCQYFDEWDCSDQTDMRSRIRIRHLLTLTSGLQWSEDWSGGLLSLLNDSVFMFLAPDSIQYVLRKPGMNEPGTHFNYSTGDPALLSGIIERVSGMTAYAFALENLFEPIGIPAVQWKSDRAGHTRTYAEIHATVREYAKFVYLYLRKGQWEDRQIVPKNWVEESTSPASGLVNWYAYLWHVNLPVRLAAEDSVIPDDGFMAEGILGQQLFVIPSRDLVIVRVATELGSTEWDAVEFLTLVLNAIEEEN